MIIIRHVPGILTRPESEWRAIEREPGDPFYLMLNYVALLALIPAICWLIGVSYFGIPVSVGTFRVPILHALFSAAIGYAATFLIVYLIALVADALAPTFESERNFQNAMKISVYSFTPFWVAGVFLLYPRLRFLAYFAGIYGVYLAWTGLPALMKTPRSKSLMFAVAILVSAVIVSIILGIVLNKISGITGARRAL